MWNGNQSNKGNDMFIELEQWWVHDSKWKKLQGTEELHLWVEKREPKKQKESTHQLWIPRYLWLIKPGYGENILRID